MLSDPKEFYRSYQKDFHKIKAEYLMLMLNNIEKHEQDLFKSELNEDERGDFRRILKSDLRQTYFHAIETVFELIFALKPKFENSKIHTNDFNLQIALTYSDWTKTYQEIQNIAKEDNALDFMGKKLIFHNHKISVGTYLFYMGTFYHEEYKGNLAEKIKDSLEAIKLGIRIIANDFINREEYNAYKHGLRIIPSATKLMLAEDEKTEPILQFDMSDSMSFFVKMKDKEEIKIITKVFDSDRDYRMINFCSALIHQMIFYRRIVMKLTNDRNKFTTVKYNIFSKESVGEHSKINVELQDIVYTITKE